MNIGKYLYVSPNTPSLEYYEAPTISAKSFIAYTGDYLGRISQENVAGIADTHTFIQVENQEQHFYLLAKLDELDIRDSLVSDSPNLVVPKRTVLEKGIDLAKSLVDFFGKFTSTKSDAADGSPVENSNTSLPNNTVAANETATENPLWAFVKMHWVWFLPSIILVPLLLYWAIKKRKKID
jgi:hypothetical protein